MKVFFIIPLFFAAFFIFLGLSTGKPGRDPLGVTLIIGGAMLAVAVLIVWAVVFIKEKREKNSNKDEN